MVSLISASHVSGSGTNLETTNNFVETCRKCSLLGVIQRLKESTFIFILKVFIVVNNLTSVKSIENMNANQLNSAQSCMKWHQK